MDHPFAAAIFAKPSTASILLGEEIPRHASIEIRETFVRKRKRPKNVTGVARAFIIRLLPDGQKGGR